MKILKLLLLFICFTTLMFAQETPERQRLFKPNYVTLIGAGVVQGFQFNYDFDNEDNPMYWFNTGLSLERKFTKYFGMGVDMMLPIHKTIFDQTSFYSNINIHWNYYFFQTKRSELTIGITVNTFFQRNEIRIYRNNEFGIIGIGATLAYKYFITDYLFVRANVQPSFLSLLTGIGNVGVGVRF